MLGGLDLKVHYTNVEDIFFLPNKARLKKQIFTVQDADSHFPHDFAKIAINNLPLPVIMYYITRKNIKKTYFSRFIKLEQ